jgi:hypothetical protein
MVSLDQRKKLFKSLIASEQGKFLLENVKLYPSEHQSVVDILLATESEW